MNEAKHEKEEGVTLRRYSSWFVLIVAIFITALITANITAVKLMKAAHERGWTMDVILYKK